MRLSHLLVRASRVLAGWLACYAWSVMHLGYAADPNGSGLAHNLRAAIDLSSRFSRSNGELWSQQAIGLDIHKVFSAKRGDIGTLVFQPYVVRIDNAPSVPAIFDDNHDQALQWRIANFNYTGFGQGRLNIRAGHFEVPFGLEHVIQTNGTLYQMNAPNAAGLKADWGLSINGQLPKLEYEAAFMGGGGNSLHTQANGYFAARVGTSRQARVWLGISALNGEAQARDAVIERRRTGLDVGFWLGPGITMLGEYSRGSEAGQHVRHLIAELSWTSRREYLFSYMQWRHSRFPDRTDDKNARRATLGLRYEPSPRWSVSIELRRDLDVRASDAAAQAQLRFRW